MRTQPRSALWLKLFLLLTSLLFSALSQAAYLVNISGRCNIYPDDQKMAIAGFVIQGSVSKRILIRALSVPGISPNSCSPLKYAKCRH